ncbi:MAG: ribosome biogenesis GTP-binding protein YihA/YsxC [Hyphomicrobiaceae bacterium]
MNATREPAGSSSGPAPEDEARAALEAGERLFAKAWQFVRGVPALEHLPPADRAEIAFAGRSNVGKSSLINALVNQHGLARTSNTPGRTQELNYFATEGVPLYLVDMPGYGYAKAPKDRVDAWTALVRDYLRGRPTLRRVLLLIDARHGVKPVDHGIMTMLDEAAVAYQIVLTKVDKISLAARAHVLRGVGDAIARRAAAFPGIIATSSEKGDGIADLRAAVVAAALIDI